MNRLSSFSFAFCFSMLLLLHAPGSLLAQARDYHAQRIVLDDGNGNTTTLQTTNATNSTFTVPSNTPNNGDVITNNSAGGTSWQAPAGVPTGTVIMNTSSTAPSGFTLISGPTQIAGASSWITKTASPTFRNAPVVLTVNGKIYAIGGYSSTLAVLGTMDVYDPTLNSWSVDATTGTFTARGEPSGAVNNGKIYVMGGNKNPGYSADNEMYDPVAKTWTAQTTLPFGRYGSFAETSGNFIYLIGGYNSGGAITNNDVYDVVNNSWNVTKTAAALPSVNLQGSSGVANGKFYLVGGYGTGGTAQLRSYDPSTNLWATLSTTNYTDRGNVTAASANGKFYVIGGTTNIARTFNVVSTTEIYDPSSDSWSAGISSGLTPEYGGRSAVINGSIYMICGQSNGTLNQSLLAGTSIYYYVKN